ncbi:hypothetical protein F4561_004057 [Lipingzhangella halophila]|uniref:Uncharacterized protein n=1 Tax=Lipingzhangella halophila TaxID=1783352 RepID=A0A7W7W3N5_9ACTN|nr:hypothetical protein [Lipingzhangella halophila]MBB4933237.1 hypothetical protein [Lipingzhangella halophila]
MSKPKVSKAPPLWKDVRALVLVNLIAVVSMVAFAAMGLSIASLGAAAS